MGKEQEGVSQLDPDAQLREAFEHASITLMLLRYLAAAVPVAPDGTALSPFHRVQVAEALRTLPRVQQHLDDFCTELAVLHCAVRRALGIESSEEEQREQ